MELRRHKDEYVVLRVKGKHAHLLHGPTTKRRCQRFMRNNETKGDTK